LRFKTIFLVFHHN